MPKVLSSDGLNDIKQWEGTKKDSDGNHIRYNDVVGKITVGYGHKLTSSEISTNSFKDGIDETAANDLLGKDVQTAVNAVNANVKAEINQNQFDSLVNFTFNVGIGAFAKSGVLKAVNAGRMKDVAGEMGKWVYGHDKKGNKVKLKDLVARRMASGVRFNTPVQSQPAPQPTPPQTPPQTPPTPPSHDLSPHDRDPHDRESHDLQPHDLDPHDLDPHDLEPHDLDPHDLEPHDLEPHDLEPHDLEPHDLTMG